MGEERRTADEPHRNVACLCGFQDLSDARTPLQVLGRIRVLRRGKGQKRVHVRELRCDAMHGERRAACVWGEWAVIDDLGRERVRRTSQNSAPSLALVLRARRRTRARARDRWWT